MDCGIISFARREMTPALSTFPVRFLKTSLSETTPGRSLFGFGGTGKSISFDLLECKNSGPCREVSTLSGFSEAALFLGGSHFRSVQPT